MNITAEKIEEHARKLALANGHKDPDHEVVCVGGRREPIWKFYRDQAVDDIVRC